VVASIVCNRRQDCTRAARIDMKSEALVNRVSDVDQRSSSARTLGDGSMPTAAPVSAQGLYLIVSDIEAARGELVARGINISEVFHARTPGAQFQPDGTRGRHSRPARIMPATAPTLRSATRTATRGCCRRSQPSPVNRLAGLRCQAWEVGRETGAS
jgi:hypothetical protein